MQVWKGVECQILKNVDVVKDIILYLKIHKGELKIVKSRLKEL